MNCGLKITKEEFDLEIRYLRFGPKKKRERESNQSVLFNQVLWQYGVVESTQDFKIRSIFDPSIF